MESKEEFRQVVLMVVGSYKQTEDVSCLHDLFSILTPYTHKIIDSLILKYDKYIGFDFFNDLLSQSYIELDAAVKLYDYSLNNNFIKYYGMRLSHTLGNFIKKEINHSLKRRTHFVGGDKKYYNESYIDDYAGLLHEELDDFETSMIMSTNVLSHKFMKYTTSTDFNTPFINQFDSISTGCFSFVSSDQKVVFFFRNLVCEDITQMDIADFLGKSQPAVSHIERKLIKMFVDDMEED